MPERVAAIEQAAAAGDREAIPALVESLNHADVIVRAHAIDALEQLTGTRMGYDPLASRSGRRQAMQRWVEAVRADRVPRP